MTVSQFYTCCFLKYLWSQQLVYVFPLDLSCYPLFLKIEYSYQKTLMVHWMLDHFHRQILHRNLGKSTYLVEPFPHTPHSNHHCHHTSPHSLVLWWWSRCLAWFCLCTNLWTYRFCRCLLCKSLARCQLVWRWKHCWSLVFSCFG